MQAHNPKLANQENAIPFRPIPFVPHAPLPKATILDNQCKLFLTGNIGGPKPGDIGERLVAGRDQLQILSSLHGVFEPTIDIRDIFGVRPELYRPLLLLNSSAALLVCHIQYSKR